MLPGKFLGVPPAIVKAVKKRLRRRFEKVMKGKRSEAEVIGFIGIDLPGLCRHLESLFQPGMTWQNRGNEGWHIDHIRPCYTFDLTDPEQVKQCWHYTNLQPLWVADHKEKHRVRLNAKS